MKPRISVLTLGVADLEQSLAFDRDGLGLPTEGIVGREFERGAVAFFELSGGLKPAIWAQDDVAHDTDLPKTPVFTIGHNVARREEVDDVMAQARRAGAIIVKSPQDTFYGGYAGYFRDPTGHLRAHRTVTVRKRSGHGKDDGSPNLDRDRSCHSLRRGRGHSEVARRALRAQQFPKARLAALVWIFHRRM
jgi:hypothetical protein